MIQLTREKKVEMIKKEQLEMMKEKKPRDERRKMNGRSESSGACAFPYMCLHVETCLLMISRGPNLRLVE